MKRLTREERRRKSKQTLALFTYLCFLLLLLIWLIGFLIMDVTAAPLSKAVQVRDVGRLPGDDVPATERCYLTEEELEEAENEMIEIALLERAVKIEDVTVTHYCTCSTCCGWSTGITASGRMATPGVSVAVDPDVIPLGADVLVDYGDGEINYYRADDTGSGVGGNHIDLCMESHEAALQAGVKTATIWWVMP